MKKSDILDYLEKQDELRELIENNVDELMKQLDINAVIANPEKSLNVFMQELIKKNKGLFQKSVKSGKELRNKL